MSDDLVERLRAYIPGEPSHENLVATRIAEAADRIEELEAALRIFAADESWHLGGRCDPNSDNFEGQAIASAALAAKGRQKMSYHDERVIAQLLRDARPFIADSGCDEDDTDVNEARNALLEEIDAALAAKEGSA